MPIGALSHKPLPKSAFTGDAVKPAMIWLLKASTAAEEMSRFHALSAGKISMVSASVAVAEQLPGLVGWFPEDGLPDESFLQLIVRIIQTRNIQLWERKGFIIDTDLTNPPEIIMPEL
jgi:hypothetical protein